MVQAFFCAVLLLGEVLLADAAERTYQLSGTLSQAVPGATPLSGSPSAGSYT